MRKVFILGMLLTLTACAYVDPSYTDQTVFYQDSPVRKSSLQVSIHPKGKQFRPLSAYFHPFVIQQQSSDYHHLSNAFAQIFHNVWMEERLFPIMEFQPGTPYRGLNEAISRARHRGADLLILGSVPYFYAGHTLDDTAITIKMDVYSTQSGQLVWTMMQSARIEARLPDDYIYFRHEYRMPEGAFNKTIRAIAKDMAVPLKGWLPDPEAEYSFARNAREVESNLAAPPETMTTDAPEKKPMSMEEDLDADKKSKKEMDSDETERPKVTGVNLDVQFDLNKDTVQQKSTPLLDALGEALNSDELKGKNVIIGGHTDATGDDMYNLKLSKRRAETVKAYLVNKWGIAPDTIEAVGYGKSRPINEGKTREERTLNRRVEIRLAE